MSAESKRDRMHMQPDDVKFIALGTDERVRNFVKRLPSVLRTVIQCRNIIPKKMMCSHVDKEYERSYDGQGSCCMEKCVTLCASDSC